jgi:hypothetical protein
VHHSKFARTMSLRVRIDKTQSEHNESAYHLIADMRADIAKRQRSANNGHRQVAHAPFQCVDVLAITAVLQLPDGIDQLALKLALMRHPREVDNPLKVHVLADLL